MAGGIEGCDVECVDEVTVEEVDFAFCEVWMGGYGLQGGEEEEKDREPCVLVSVSTARCCR